MAQYSEPSKARKTFVLRCDKPRYDGGVDIDLERYFGRRLQPNQKPMNKAAAQTQLEQVDRLKQEARRILNHHLEAGRAQSACAEADDEAEMGCDRETNETAVALAAPAWQGHNPTLTLWHVVCQGPQDMALGAVGVLLSVAALISAYGANCPMLVYAFEPLLRHFSHRLAHGLRTVLATPGQVLSLLPAMAYHG